MAPGTLGNGGPGVDVNCRGEKQTEQRKGFSGGGYGCRWHDWCHAAVLDAGGTAG